MPNWCHNYLRVYHPQSEMVARFKRAAEEGRLFEEFVPIPEDQKETEFWWRVGNWGTKWDVQFNPVHCYDGDHLEGYFESAWSPPVNFYRKLEQLGFTVDAVWCESGMCFYGRYFFGYQEDGSWSGDEEYIEDYNFPEWLTSRFQYPQSLPF